MISKKSKTTLVLYVEGTGLVAQLVFKTSNRRIKPSVAGSIPALSAISN